MREWNSNTPKTPLEAAIDKATGYKPGDEDRVVSDAGQDGQEAAETKPASDETKPAEVKENGLFGGMWHDLWRHEVRVASQGGMTCLLFRSAA